MGIKSHSECLSVNGINTGIISSYLSFTTGSGYFCSNDKYSLNDQVISGFPVLDLNLGLIVKNEGSNQDKISGVFNGDGLVKIGKDVDLTNTCLYLDFESSFCYLQNENKQGVVLISTRPSGHPESGFIVGINRAGRLFAEYTNSNGVEKSFSLSNEISDKAIITVNQVGYSLSLSYKDYETETLKVVNSPVNDLVTTDELYLGGDFNLEGTNYTGFSGIINSFALFSESLNDSERETLCDCSFSTGFYQSQVGSYIENPITGYSVSSVDQSGIASYSYILTEEDGKDVYISSGVSGLLTSYDSYNYLTGESTSYDLSGNIVGYDFSLKAEKSIKKLSFVSNAQSGDFIEIISYKNAELGKNINTYNFKLVRGDYDNVLLYHNGLLNIEGLDFFVDPNGVFTDSGNQGYDSTDYFVYTPTNSNIITENYTGQFPSGVDGHVYITGVSGTVLTGYDLYFNGQRLIKEYDYTTGLSGSYECVIIYSGEVPEQDLSFSSALSFVEINNIDDRLVQVIECTDSCNNFDLTGYTEDVWLNGVKQAKNLNYTTYHECSLNSGISQYEGLGYLFFNNNTNYFNI